MYQTPFNHIDTLASQGTPAQLLGWQVPQMPQTVLGWQVPQMPQTVLGWQVPQMPQTVLGWQVPQMPQTVLGWQVPQMPQTVADSISKSYAIHPAHSASELFSSTSTLNPELTQGISHAAAAVEHLPMPWMVMTVLFITFGYYLYILYRYWGYIPTLFRISLSLNKTLMEYEAKTNEQKGLEIHTSILLVLALVATIVEFGQNSIEFTPINASIILGIVCALFLYKYIIVSLCEIFSDDLIRMRKVRVINSYFISLTAILYTPMVVASLTNVNENRLLINVLLLLWILYLIRLWGVFIRSGFGKLQWLLYLCIVEILPVSFLWALAVRYY